MNHIHARIAASPNNSNVLPMSSSPLAAGDFLPPFGANCAANTCKMSEPAASVDKFVDAADAVTLQVLPSLVIPHVTHKPWQKLVKLSGKFDASNDEAQLFRPSVSAVQIKSSSMTLALVAKFPVAFVQKPIYFHIEFDNMLIEVPLRDDGYSKSFCGSISRMRYFSLKNLRSAGTRVLLCSVSMVCTQAISAARLLKHLVIVSFTGKHFLH